MGDRSQLVQLMDNLIGNGLKYHGDKAPHVHVSAERNGNKWTFSVSDNGIGIAPEYYERIFEIFQRLHDKKDYPGTGIGLAVCRRIVGGHGGTVWVESEPGQGSTFHFTIPAGAGKNLVDSKQPSGRPAQVLLVEDNNNDVELTRLAFEMSQSGVSPSIT